MPPRRRPDGTLLVECRAARPGIYEYRTADGKVRREFVPAETLRDSAGGLARLAVTLHHPDGDVTPDNVKELGVGDTDGEVVLEDDGFVRVKMAVRDRDAIRSIESGSTREVSPGYAVLLDETPGEHPEFGRYDAVQKARRYNHLALVDMARGGHDCRLRLDGAAVMTEPLPGGGTLAASRRTDKEPRMNPRIATLLALLGVTARVDSDDAGLDQAIEGVKNLAKARTDADKAAEEAAGKAKSDADKELEKLKEDNEKLKAENDKLKADMEAFKAEEKKKADAAERAELLKVASAFKVDGADKLELPALRQAIASAFMGKAMRSDATDAYITAAVDMAKARLQEGGGREDGRRAWEGLGEPRRQDDDDDKDRRRTDDDGRDPWTKQQDAAFRAGRGDK